MKIATYDTDLTHDQWHLLRRFLPAAKKRGRPRAALRAVINAIRYLVKTGAQWRFLLVDTLGLLLGVTLAPADGPERKGARSLLAPVLADYPALCKRWVDGGFNGPEFAAWVQTHNPRLVGEVVKRLAEVPGFHVLPKPWVVERTFGWLMHCRRLVRDHEQTAAAAANWIYLAMIRLMLRRLA